jgi:hypothetical protein
MFWVVQNNLYNEYGYTALMDVLERMDIPHKVVRVVPFFDRLIDINFDLDTYMGDIDQVPEIEIDNSQKIMICGAMSLGRIAKKKGWFPGQFMNDNMNYNKWREAWGQQLLNYDAYVCKFKDVEWWYGDFFIRPTNDGKDFSGLVTTWPEFVTWRKLTQDFPNDGLTLNMDTEVMVSPLKKIYSETRFFVVDGHIIAKSQYKLGRRVTYNAIVDEHVESYARWMIHEWTPDRAFVIDIADTPDGCKIIECNTFNSSGFYACDVSAIVQAVERMEF